MNVAAVMSGGFGHQVERELRNLDDIKSTLEEARMKLGRTEHLELAQFIDKAINEAARLTICEDDALNEYL